MCSQNYQLADSILRVAEQSNSDSIKMMCYSRLSEFYRGINAEKQLFYSNKTIFHANQINNMHFVIFGKLKRVVSIFDMGETDNAFKEMEKVIKEAEEYNDSNLLASIYNQCGVLHRQTSNFSEAMKYLTKAIKIAEEIGREYDAAGSYNNIAIIYNSQGDTSKALEYFKYALEIYKKDINKTNYAKLLVNTAIIYTHKKEYNKALEMTNEAMEIWVKMDKKAAIGETYSCLADIYDAMGDDKNAFKYLNKSLEIRTALNNRRGIAESYGRLGNFYFKQKQFHLAIPILEKAIGMAKEFSLLELEKESHNLLYKIYKEKKDYQSALQSLNNYLVIKDSLFNTENLKTIELLKNKLDKEKNERELELTNIKLKNSELELNKQKQKFIFSIGASALLICIVLLIIAQQIKSKRINKILNDKNRLIEEKNKSITDSINYAKRIQSAILPSLKSVESVLPESFILYKPKDIVAGDFYWFEKNENSVLYAVADCTGHGVPGAMVSVVCNNALNRSVREFNLIEPGKILDKTRELVVQEFSKSDEDVKDGMDISICSLDASGKNQITLKWAGANNPLWIVRDSKLIEFKPNKQPIGKTENPIPFTTQLIQLNKNDIVYIFTDGFADQFGGENGKKFKAAQLKELLLSIHHKTPKEQESVLNAVFETWKGKNEQVDDVSIIGVKV
ncbi:MAG: tetratricopeptide repeat protein [Bacteroidetes bacterium]|nr:tetratricopeptide repeat protein [Flavobacteriales bacterium]NOG94203.1 tetratricopeptide repeat protein [Bacteroidota bacterium]WKZ76519.1 MAG: tetratricopeptide repeat protein [Vicingaceae bacterium]GIK69516.1 MAG: hypothetical protein BroJett020_08110 [Bacteroidota bacterium]